MEMQQLRKRRALPYSLAIANDTADPGVTIGT